MANIIFDAVGVAATPFFIITAGKRDRGTPQGAGGRAQHRLKYDQNLKNHKNFKNDNIFKNSQISSDHQNLK